MSANIIRPFPPRSHTYILYLKVTSNPIAPAGKEKSAKKISPRASSRQMFFRHLIKEGSFSIILWVFGRKIEPDASLELIYFPQAVSSNCFCF